MTSPKEIAQQLSGYYEGRSSAGFTDASSCCRWCGESHGIRCPWVKALDFGPAGEIKRVEFLTPADMGPSPPVEPEQPDYPRIK